MMINVANYREKREIVYNPSQWELLRTKRERALNIMERLNVEGIPSMVHGSVARGDVNAHSDVDVIIPYVVPSFQVELALVKEGYRLYSRKIAQATPGHAPKGHIVLDAEERASVTFPLVPFRTLEREFYKFGGRVDLREVKADIRVPGCTKKLMLVEPTARGHSESLIQGREAEVAKIISVSVDIIKERIRVLTRRARVGRTGIFLTVSLKKDDVFEEVLKRLIDTNPIVRRRCATK